MKIAVLLTCHNRRKKTLKCLDKLFSCLIPENYQVQVFLVDDGSTDGTSQAVTDNFPRVNIIRGDGNLFWNQGMRLAWEVAVKKDEFDFYLWLNDDTLLDKDAIIELLECNEESLRNDNKSAIITGACRASFESKEFSYGGRTDSGKVKPNGKLQKCKYINGNAVLVHKEVFLVLGNLSNNYTHAIGDFDYGLRAINAGVDCYTTKSYIATCPTNQPPQWSDPKVPLKKRLILFYSPKGLNYTEYIYFRRKFWGKKWFLFAMKAYLKLLFPRVYSKLSS